MAKKVKPVSILLRLPPDVAGELTTFCAVVGLSRNQFLEDIVREALPTLRELVKAAQLAKQGATAPVARRLAHAMSRAMADAHKTSSQAAFEFGKAAGSAGHRSPARRKPKTGGS